MKIWIEQNLLVPLFLFLGLLSIITLCLTGGFAASVQGLQSGVILLSFLWGLLVILGLLAAVGYARAERCPRCGRRFSLISEHWVETISANQARRHSLVRCQKCGFVRE